jgi:dimethylargininase
VPTALTREVSSALAACELTHLARVAIDVELARTEHAAYEQALREAGYAVQRLPATSAMPDSVFIEDIAVVFAELAIVTRPGAESRRAEIPVVAEALARYRRVESIEAPATVDGGDVLVAGRRVFVGRSSRTNRDGIAALRRLLEPLRYTVCEVAVRGCLHLKSAVTALTDRLLLVNPSWVDRAMFADFDFIEIDPLEPMAANALRLDDRVIYSAAHPRTAGRLAKRGIRLEKVYVSELAKAEGAVTCCSLIIDG